MDNQCIYCGEIIPEGRLVCPNCEKKVGVGSCWKATEKYLHCKRNNNRRRERR